MRSDRTARIRSLTSSPTAPVAALVLIATGCASSGSANSDPPQQGEWKPLKPQAVFQAAEAYGATHAFVGIANVEDSFDPVEDPIPFGFVTSYESADYWVGWEGGFQFWEGEGDEPYVPPGAITGERELKVRNGEIYGGLHKTLFWNSRVKPFFGLGLTLAWTWQDEQRSVTNPVPPAGTITLRNTEHDNFFTFGVYARGGLEFQISENVMMGIDLRWLEGTDVGFFSPTTDIDSQQAAVFIGFGG